MSLRIRQRYLTRCDISRWVFLAQSTMMILCHLGLLRRFQTSITQLKSFDSFPENTICPQSTWTSHTILQPVFLKGNCFSLPLLPLLGHVNLLRSITDIVLQTTMSAQVNTFINAALKMQCHFFPHISEASLERKYVHRPELKKIYFSNIKNKL